jgi:hypothetical protein
VSHAHAAKDDLPGHNREPHGNFFQKTEDPSLKAREKKSENSQSGREIMRSPSNNTGMHATQTGSTQSEELAKGRKYWMLRKLVVSTVALAHEPGRDAR